MSYRAGDSAFTLTPFSFCSNDCRDPGRAFSYGWRITARRAAGKQDGMKRHRECAYWAELGLETLVWTRGRAFPLSWLQTRLRCPACGSRHVAIAFVVPSERQTGPRERATPAELKRRAVRSAPMPSQMPADPEAPDPGAERKHPMSIAPPARAAKVGCDFRSRNRRIERNQRNSTLDKHIRNDERWLNGYNVCAIIKALGAVVRNGQACIGGGIGRQGRCAVESSTSCRHSVKT